MMNSLPPVKGDRIICELPLYFTRDAAVHTKDGFNITVREACQGQKTGLFPHGDLWLVPTMLNVAKIIVVGDVGVGKTCLINRFCKDTFDKTYKATIGVDFEMERFEVLGVPFNLQLWDTAGQERFRCIASTYYRGAQAIIVVFDLSNYNSLDNAREWLEDAMRDNDPSSVLLFLVGTKKDLSHPDQLAQMEQEAVKLSEEIRAEYWAVSALSGDSVRDFFLRVASLTFEATVLSELERNNSRQVGDIVKISNNCNENYKKRQSNCCR
ncbi:ras-related protein Rab-34 isoform X1 [Chanodichthys erythropterus]|uniref:ras-related protein Rab-34 isoform X1 n=1 Tax=Chanodichthys erythropterus TaxID=933992 RepID=UPI00351F6954